jgi:hypothetical protein
MSDQDHPPPDTGETPEETAEKIARGFFKIEPDPASRQAAVLRFLLSAAASIVVVPLLHWLMFGQVDGFAWGMTIFFVVYCLLAAVGIFFLPRTEFHTRVRLVGDLADRIGAFWLVSCAFGPLLGWMITSILPSTLASWRWLYGARALLAIGLPLLTALPLLRYVRGKAATVALPLLVVITLLPMLSAVNVSRDLWQGAVARQAQNGQVVQYLEFTRHTLER